MVNTLGGWRAELERLCVWGADERICLAKAGHAKVDQEFSTPVAGFGIYPDLIQDKLFNYSSVAIRADF